MIKYNWKTLFITAITFSWHCLSLCSQRRHTFPVVLRWISICVSSGHFEVKCIVDSMNWTSSGFFKPPTRGQTFFNSEASEAATDGLVFIDHTTVGFQFLESHVAATQCFLCDSGESGRGSFNALIPGSVPVARGFVPALKGENNKFTNKKNW